MSSAPPAPERPESPRHADERATLRGMLDHHRGTLLQKVAGLDATQLGVTIPPSTMHLAGLVKHLTFVEEWWFGHITLGDELPEPWASVDWDSDPDWEWRTAVDDDPASLVAGYRAACERSRTIEADRDLDAPSALASRGAHASFRWVMLHMIEETARHNGHADLLREVADGTTGY